jgi:hypothetical protein
MQRYHARGLVLFIRAREIRTPFDRRGALRARIEAKPSNWSQSAALDNPRPSASTLAFASTEELNFLP